MHWPSVLKRGTYARTTGDLLVNDPDGFPSAYPPVWWLGIDSGGGLTPIGPNGPFANGAAAAPAVTRATSLICGPLTAAPYRIKTGTTALGEDSAGPRWVSDPMLARPDDRFGPALYPAALTLPRSLFWTCWVRSAIWYGLGAFICQTDPAGAPVAGTLRLVDTRLLSTQRGEDNALRWVVGAATGGEPVAVFDRDGRIQLGAVEYRIVVLRNPHSEVDTEGMSAGVFAQYPQVFGLSGQIDTYSSGTFRSGIPAGYLQVETPGLDQTTADDLKARWLAAHGGDRRSIAVLNATTKFVALNLSPVDAALGEVKRLNLADLAFAFALDPYNLGISLANSATYANVTDAWRQHRDFGLSPWISAVQDTLSALVPAGQSVTVNLDGFANPPAGERYAAYQTALTAGILTVDEVRLLEGLPPMPAAPPPNSPGTPDGMPPPNPPTG